MNRALDTVTRVWRPPKTFKKKKTIAKFISLIRACEGQLHLQQNAL